MWEQKCSEEDWAVPWRSSTLKVSPPHLCLQSETTHFSLQLLFPFFLFFFFLFHFPFSFSLFLFSAPFSSFSFLPFTSFVHNLQSRSFEITYLHFSRIGSIFFILYQFLLCLMDVAKKIVIFLFRFSLFPSRICIGRAWLFFSYRLTSFSPLFLIWDKKCLISFSSKPTTANMALLCFLSSGFFDNSKSFLSDVH